MCLAPARAGAGEIARVRARRAREVAAADPLDRAYSRLGLKTEKSYHFKDVWI